jgi:hypothetical protein
LSSEKRRRLERLEGSATSNGVPPEVRRERVRKAITELIESGEGSGEFMTPAEQERFFSLLHAAVRERSEEARRSFFDFHTVIQERRRRQEGCDA